jgi:hypothetical protein
MRSFPLQDLNISLQAFCKMTSLVNVFAKREALFGLISSDSEQTCSVQQTIGVCLLSVANTGNIWQIG